MTNKPKITVTPDDGGHDNTISVDGAKQTAYEPNDKYEHYDDSDFLYHAIERIAELEAERDQLREQNAALAAHVEKLAEACNDLLHGEMLDSHNRDINGLLCMGTDDDYCVKVGNKINRILNDAPTNTLRRRDLIKQAEGE